MLDYKIKELKKQIEPREVEIMDMKEQIKDMDLELERYHKNNSSLELTISDLRLKLEGMQREILKQRTGLGDQEAKLRGLKTELHETIQHIQDPTALKNAIKKMYQKHVTESVASRAMEPDIAAEYTRQREYLEKSVESLKRKLNKNMELHRSDNMRMMNENVTLVKEVSTEQPAPIASLPSAPAFPSLPPIVLTLSLPFPLREQINELRREIKQMKMAQSANAMSGGPGPSSAGGGAEVARLRQRIEELESGATMAQRPASRERALEMPGGAGP